MVITTALIGVFRAIALHNLPRLELIFSKLDYHEELLRGLAAASFCTEFCDEFCTIGHARLREGSHNLTQSYRDRSCGVRLSLVAH